MRLAARKQSILAKLVYLAISASLFLPPQANALISERAPGNDADAVDTKVNQLLSQLTFEEKVKLMSGTKDEMHIPGIERLKIPELKFSDGPVGVRVWGRSTAYPAGAMLAATWDVEAAREMGRTLGRDCKARGVHVLLGPGVDLYRVAQCGRNFEYFGEDPYLSARITTSWIQGLQKEGVAASVKHYAANDQEILRDSVNTIVSERRLHEICFPPFKAAVQEANSWTVMAAYNKINGEWCTANKYLLTDVLRNQWGFKGILMSDWGAVHECLKPITAGTDLEMGKGVYYTVANIKKYMQEGKITQDQIDEHVRRILRMTVAMGFMDHPQEEKSIPLDDASSAAAAIKIAREGLVLLRNHGDFLPLSREKAKNIVVLGPNACPAVTGGGGSSQTDSFTSVSLLDAIKTVAGPGTKVTHIPTWMGPNPTSNAGYACKGFFEARPEDGQRGARAEFFASTDLSGTPVVTRTDATINYRWGDWHPVDQITAKTFSVRWTGKIKFDQTDDYVFSCCTDGAKVTLDGKVLFDNWSTPGIQSSALTQHMEKDVTHDLIVEYHHLSGSSAMQLAWGKASQRLTADEQKQIAAADAVVLAAGFNPWLETEGSDRTYDLPGEQVELIRNVSHLNPHTIVVLNGGGNVGMSRWIDHVAGVFHAWYPGQNGNTAVAEAIFGDLNPSGKLPDTFEEKFEDSPAYGNYPGDSANGGTVKYAEGIYVGYRWFDKKNVTPRFPFGYGLSYTTFAMDNIKIDSPDSNPRVSVTVTNTGQRKGTSVVQLYVRPIDSQIDRPVQELKGFQRVELNPGESKVAVFDLNADSFATYDEKKHGWISPSGAYEVAIGSSSRDIHCARTLNWHSK